MTSIYSYLCSLSWSRVSPHLHSFPTRRSSDLTVRGRSKNPPEGRDPDSTRKSQDPSLNASVCARRIRISPFRSEEHTSELQSRENLVCRLLLEKKKNENNQRTVADCM